MYINNVYLIENENNNKTQRKQIYLSLIMYANYHDIAKKIKIQCIL